MCGIVGVHNLQGAAGVAREALVALTNRGPDATGIAVHNPEGGPLILKGGEGTAEQVYDVQQLASFAGRVAIGEDRYTTDGDVGWVQPTYENDGTLSLVHNGNLSRLDGLKHDMEQLGIDTSDANDTQLISRRLAHDVRNGASLEEGMANLFWLIADAGSFCLIATDTSGKMVVLRDPNAIQPLVVAKKDDGHVVASETNALDAMGVHCTLENEGSVWRDVKPGEMLVFDENGMRPPVQLVQGQNATCSLNFIYLADDNSILYHQRVGKIRENIGRRLAIEHPPLSGQKIISVPKTADPFTKGYVAQARENGIEVELVDLLYIPEEAKGTRSFMQPTPAKRINAARKKLKIREGATVPEDAVIVDDSIIRGNVQRVVSALLRRHGMKRVHVRIGSPPAKHPNRQGVATSEHAELASHERTVDQVREYINADSLGHISLGGLIDAINPPPGYTVSTPDFNGVNPIEQIHEGSRQLVRV